MRVEEIEKLLVLFYEGNTTESQEEMLKKYFETQEVPEHLERDKMIFLSFRENTFVEVPARLEDRLSRMIDAKEEEEKLFFHKNKSKRNWRWVGGIAASVLLLVGISYSIFSYQYTIEKPQDTFSNPEDAYKVLQATLIEVSTDMNCGINQLSETKKEIKNINKEIRKQIKQP